VTVPKTSDLSGLEAQELASCEVLRPKVGLRMYLPEIVLLALSVVIPVAVCLIWHDGQLLARSGSLTVLCAAIAEFTTLNRINRKHLLNACRARKGEKPWDFSHAARAVGIASLVAALAGTALWAYGDFLWKTP
jgi:hypothetical protein